MKLYRRRKETEIEISGLQEESNLSTALQGTSSTDLTAITNVIGDNLVHLRGKRDAFDFVVNENITSSKDFESSAKWKPHKISTLNNDAGHIFTAAEVAQALKREESPKSQGREKSSEGKLDGTGMKKKNEETGGTGIFGTKTKPWKWSLAHYLQSVASTKEKIVVAVSAWIIALTGLIVALVFVTKDFLASREEMASTVHYAHEEKMQLPPIWFCTLGTMTNHFADFPTEEYKGQPLFWIDFIDGVDSRGKVTYPKTKSLKQLESFSIDTLGRACDGMKVMDAKIYGREDTENFGCSHCIAISRKPAIELSAHGNMTDGGDGSSIQSGGGGRIGFRISRHFFVGACRLVSWGLNGDTLRFFRTEMKKHHVELQRRGILDFGGIDPKMNSADGYLWPPYRYGYANVTVDWGVADVADMFCNVYMFSGFFYPSTSRDLKYRFNSRLFVWERSGAGPYHPAEFDATRQVSSWKSFPRNNNSVIGQEVFENLTKFNRRTVDVITNTTRHRGVETLVSLEPNNMASLHLSRRMVRGRESYESKVLRTTLASGDVRTFNNVYYLDISFRSFLTQQVSDLGTVSWTAFIADFFGLTSLFLDVSVYTLIIAPLIVRARKRAMVARRIFLKRTKMAASET